MLYGNGYYTYSLSGIPCGQKSAHEPEIVGYQTFTGSNNWRYNYTSDVQPNGGMRNTVFNVNAYELRNITQKYSMYINWQPEASTEHIQFNVELLRTVQRTIGVLSGTDRLKDSFETSYNGSAATARLTSVYYAVPLNFTSDNSNYIGFTRQHSAMYTGALSANGFFYRATSTGSLLIGNNIIGTHTQKIDGIDGRGNDGYKESYTAIKTNDLTDSAKFFMKSASARSSDNYVYMTAMTLHDEPITFQFDCVGSPYRATGLTVNNTASSNQVSYLTKCGFCTYRNIQSGSTAVRPESSVPFYVSATANYAIYQ